VSFGAAPTDGSSPTSLVGGLSLGATRTLALGNTEAGSTADSASDTASDTASGTAPGAPDSSGTVRGLSSTMGRFSTLDLGGTGSGAPSAGAGGGGAGVGTAGGAGASGGTRSGGSDAAAAAAGATGGTALPETSTEALDRELTVGFPFLALLVGLSAGGFVARRRIVRSVR
jgi:endoglucanase